MKLTRLACSLVPFSALVVALVNGCSGGGANVAGGDTDGGSSADGGVSLDGSTSDGQGPQDGATSTEPGVGCVDPASTSVSPTFERRTVANAEARHALCNDGTPAVYYVRRGTGCGAGRWVIGLEGGGSCNTAAECAAREIGQKSSSASTPTKTLGGIFSPDPAQNPDFFTANGVYVDYCSSDNWVGRRDASADTNGFGFHGKDIFAAVLEDLGADITSAPNLSQASEILLAGSSAGGLGVVGNADVVKERFPKARVRAIDDAGWVADMLSYAPPGQTGLPVTAELDARIAYWTGVPDASCAAVESAHLGKCSVGPVVFPYLSVPLFVHEDLRDPVQLTMLGVNAAPNAAEKTKYRDAFAASLRTSLAPVTGVFSPNAGDHGIVFSPSFATRTAGGTTMREALGNWYFERAGTKKAIE
jgi:hypothetical protein